MVGSNTLANVLAQTRYGGTVAACGLAQGMDLPASVAPFILRGVTLAGDQFGDGAEAETRRSLGAAGADLDLAKLHGLTQTRPIRDVVELAPDIIAGKVKGRIVLEVA